MYMYVVCRYIVYILVCLCLYTFVLHVCVPVFVNLDFVKGHSTDCPNIHIRNISPITSHTFSPPTSKRLLPSHLKDFYP